MTSQERRVLDAIDQELLLALLGDLVAIESLGGRETPAQEYMARQMEALGFAVDTWTLDLDRLRQHPAYTVEIERDEALGVVGRIGSGDGPTLVLNGHVDVVPAGERDRWSHPPFAATVEAGKVYGRGTADMKGALCCALMAMEAVQAAGVSLAGTVLLQSVVGEEDGGLGTLAAVERGYRGDAAIVMEPTELMVAPAQAGAFNFRVTVPGVAAHGALRTEGVDPIDAFIPLYRALQAFERERNRAVSDPLFVDYDVPFALCVGTLRAGIWASTVAESLVFEGRLGVGPHEDAAQVRRAFEDVLQDAAHQDAWLRDHPPTVEWWGAQFLPAHT
ncbi:MAG: ArgE/DapE family deacylase, partial [Bacteroidetes bacterium]|nr:ArgE/DapE family deacylase [Bacteroidota bacterium]